MADEDILGSLGLDASSYLATLAQVETASADFVSRTQAQFAALTLPAVDTTAYTAGLAAVQSGAQTAATANTGLASSQDVVSQAGQVAAAAMQQQAQAQSQVATATETTAAATRSGASAVQEETAAHGASSAVLKQHAAANSEAAREVMGLRQETVGLAADALPQLRGQITIITGTVSAFLTSVRAVNDEEKSFTQTTAIMGAGLTAAGVGGAAGFFAIFDSGLTTLKTTAAQFGLTIPQVAGLDAALQSVGLPAGSATVALRMMSVQLEQLQQDVDKGQEPSGRFALGMQRIGVSAVDAHGNVQTLDTLMPQVFANFKRAAEEAAATGQPFDAAGVAADLFGQRAGPKMVPLLLEGAAGFQKYTEEATKAGIGSQDQVAHLEALHTATATASLEFQGMATKIGSDVAPSISTAITLAGNLASTLGGLPPPLRDSIVTFPLLAGGMLLSVAAGSQLLNLMVATVPALVTRAAASGAVVAADAVQVTADEAVALAMYAMFDASKEVEAGELLLVTGGQAAAASMTELAVSETAAAAASTSLMLTPLGVTLMALTVVVGLGVLAWNQYRDAQQQTKDAQDATFAAMRAQTGEVTAEVGKLTAAGLSQAQVSDIAKEKMAALLPEYTAAAAALSHYSDVNKINAVDVKDHLDQVEKLHPGFTQLYDDAVRLGGAYMGWDAAQKAADTDTKASAGVVDIQAAALAKLRDSLGLAADGSGELASTNVALAAAVQKAGQNTAESTAFQIAYGRAAADARQTDDQWAETKRNLQALMSSGTDADKAEAQAELLLGQATRDWGGALVAAAIAAAQLTEQASRLEPVLRQIQSDLLADVTASQGFSTALATGAAESSAQFAGLFGAAAQSAAASLHAASLSAVDSWHSADAQVYADESSLQFAITSNATQEEQKRLEQKLSADQLIRQSALTAANEAIADEKAYVDAVRQASADSLTYKAKLFDNELKLSHETATEKETDLADWLQAENIVINDILNLERMLAQETGAIDRAVTEVLIANDKARLDALAENAREATATAAANAADIKIDDSQARKDAAALRADQAAQIEGMHGLVSQQTDLNSVQQAGIELEKQGLDLQKQVKETGALVTADQLAGLHAVTEANRGVAQSELAAAQAAQAHYADVVSSIDLATGFSTKYSQQEIDLAKAQYENSQRLLNQGVSTFDAALAAEQKAQSTFDSQQQASAAATVQLAADRRSLAAAELSSTLALTTAAVEGAGRVSDSQTQAAAQAMAAWRAADAQVLADDQALTGDLSAEDRKRLEDKRKTDQGIADDARTTAQKEIAATQDAVSAANKLDQDRRTGARTVRDLMLADAQSMNHAILTSEIDRNGQLIATDVSLAQYETGANRQRIADYQAANARVVADELALTGNLSESERNRLNAVLVSDTRIRDDRLATAQQGIQDERDYATASVDALNKVIGATTDAFDAQHHLNNLTAEERQAGLGQYLAAEVSIDAQIVLLETQLANTTDAIARASIQSRIDGLGLLLNANKLFVHEAEVGAQDIKDAEDKAKQAAQDSMTSVASSAADAGRAIQDEIKQLTAGMDAEAAAVQRVIDKYQQLQGVFGAPSTEELGLTVQADKLKIAIAQLEEQGTLSTDPRVVALQKQLDLLTPQIQAYQNERSAEEELAKSQGDLNAGMSNGIDVIRGSVQMLTALEEEQTRANKILMTFYDTTGHAVTAWADQTVSQVDRVKAGYQDLIKALQDASGQQQSGGGFHAPAAGSPLPTEMFPTYAVGTNRVPNDGLAYLHRDEIVVPAGLAVGQQGTAFRPAAGPVQLVVPVTVNGTQLSPVQLQRAIQAGVGAALSEATGRDVTLAGLRS